MLLINYKQRFSEAFFNILLITFCIFYSSKLKLALTSNAKAVMQFTISLVKIYRSS